ncbi:MAG: flagellar basal-body rod protein FlgB [Desulfobacca sp. 4484_104]|nr:MAG: flagellar basal-body rod protein FlgB [Desulfobacca sp. 4484_104]RLA88103.1 MAG: flagellar basal body rod protein FlgB [Deltaproteobacteria bacterium]
MSNWGNLSDPIINLLNKAMTFRTRRQEIIATNVANLDTPNYTRQDLDFKTALSSYLNGNGPIGLNRTNHRHIPGGGPGLSGQVQDTQEPVDIDQEMIKMTQNNLLFHANLQMLIKKLDTLRGAIEGGT